MQFIWLLWITARPSRAWVGSVSNKYNPSTKLDCWACISSRITTVIHVMFDHQINYNCFNEPFAVLPCESLYWDMHGLIFETSIWLLAGSTRLIQHCKAVCVSNNFLHTTYGACAQLSCGVLCRHRARQFPISVSARETAATNDLQCWQCNHRSPPLSTNQYALANDCARQLV